MTSLARDTAVEGGRRFSVPPSPKVGNGAAAKLPKYAVLRDRLAEGILSGAIPSGEKLPSETALGRSFDVSRVTVRHALQALREAGLVESRQGRGHYARRVRIGLEIGRLMGLGEILRPQGIPVAAEVLSAEEVRGRPQDRKDLELAPAARPVRIVRLRRVGTAAVCFETRLVRPEPGRRLLGRNLQDTEFTRLYVGELGVELGYAQVTIDHVDATADAAHALGVAEGSPLLRIRHLVFDDAARPLEICERLCLPDAFEITARAGRW